MKNKKRPETISARGPGKLTALLASAIAVLVMTVASAALAIPRLGTGDQEKAGRTTDLPALPLPPAFSEEDLEEGPEGAVPLEGPPDGPPGLPPVPNAPLPPGTGQIPPAPPSAPGLPDVSEGSSPVALPPPDQPQPPPPSHAGGHAGGQQAVTERAPEPTPRGPDAPAATPRPHNEPPVANDDHYRTNEAYKTWGFMDFPVFDNDIKGAGPRFEDGSPFKTQSYTRSTAYAQVELTHCHGQTSRWCLRYHVRPGVSGPWTDTLRYTIIDAMGETDSATVYIQVPA